MDEPIISYRTALFAKEKGCTSSTFNNNYNYYEDSGQEGNHSWRHLQSDSPCYITQGLLTKWLRIEHGLCLFIDWNSQEGVIVDYKNHEGEEVFRRDLVELHDDGIDAAMDELLYETLKLIKE